MEKEKSLTAQTGLTSIDKSKLKCLADRNVQVLRQIERGLTIERSLNEGLMIDTAIRQHGDECVEMALSGLILMTAEYFNVQGNITPMQAVMIAGDLITKHSFENIEDIILALQNIRTSGTSLYGKFDAQTIFDSMDTIMDQKIGSREDRWTKEKEKYLFPALRGLDSHKELRELHREAQLQYLQNKAKTE
jgi:hypothetical protein